MNNVEKFLWLNTIVAIVGTFLNAKQIRFGFLIWMATNAIFVIYNIYIASYPQAALFSVYFFLAIYGWLNWGKQTKPQVAPQEENI